MNKSILVIAIFLMSSTLTLAKDAPKVREVKEEVRGIFELSLDVDKDQAIAIGKDLKQNFKFSKIGVRQNGPASYGIFVETSLKDDSKVFKKWIRDIKARVNKKFGKNTVSGWDITQGIHYIE